MRLEPLSYQTRNFVRLFTRAILVSFLLISPTFLYLQQGVAWGKLNTAGISPMLASRGCPSCGAKMIEDPEVEPAARNYSRVCSRDRLCGTEARICAKCGKHQQRCTITFGDAPDFAVIKKPSRWYSAGCTCARIDQGNAGQPSTTRPATTKQTRHPDKPSATGESSEFWSEEEKEFISSVLTGLGLLGGSGVGLYLLLQSLGLIGAKTATSAGVLSSAGAEASIAPNIGDARDYVDENGTRWVEVFNGSNWVDSATFSAGQAQATDNQAWQQREFERQSSGDNAFNKDIKAKADERSKEWAVKREVTRNEIRNINKLLQEMAESDRKIADITLAAKETQLNFLENTKTVIDCIAVPIVSTALGPAGTIIANAYTATSEVAAGASTGFVNSASTAEAIVNAVKGGVKGAVTGSVSVLVGEGLNSACAVGSTAIRTVCSKTPTKVLHYDSSSAEVVNKLWSNFSSGKQLSTGLLKTPPQIPPPLRLRMNRINSAAIEKRAREISKIKDAIKAERKSDLVWGVASGCKSYSVDSKVTGAINDRLFAS